MLRYVATYMQLSYDDFHSVFTHTDLRRDDALVTALSRSLLHGRGITGRPMYAVVECTSGERPPPAAASENAPFPSANRPVLYCSEV